ncbi:MAG TPA: M1 family aminopeptidase [Bryobacteraceae bacterium]|nr:M1 family aminopeptidase [Bryobacteraceae bacterium]
MTKKVFELAIVAAGAALVPLLGQGEFGPGALARAPQQQSSEQQIDVQAYAIDAQIDPHAQTLAATAKVSFIPLENTSTVSFELNHALSLDKVTDAEGREVPTSRLDQDMSVRLSLPQALVKGQPATLTFVYGGKLTGTEESPVFGIKFAAIKPDAAYLMYPARWFPVSGYTTDRFSADLKVTVPNGYHAIASGIESPETAPDGMTATRWKFTQASFPGSLAVVQGDPKSFNSGGVTTTFYTRTAADMASPYADEFARAMTYFTSLYGLPFQKDLTVIETEDGAPNGYSAPGLVFLAPSAIGKQVNMRLVANQVSQQWWGVLVSPTTRNHMWIQNGLARYSELLYVEHVNGPGAMQQAVHDTYVEALTVDQPPLDQAARLEDYSPEFWAATAGKGAAVLNMLRSVMGDDNFFKLLMAVPQKYGWKSISTEDFRKVAEGIYGQDLNYFFLQWIDSSGAPEFKLDYTVFRTKTGFRVSGKVSQDLDTFRMPVQIHIDTEGDPENKTIEVVGTSSAFSIDTFGKPRPGGITLDPKGQVLRFDNAMRVAVAIRRGEQYAQISEFNEALKQYQKALEVTRNSSLAHYRIAELFFLQGNLQSAANEYREALAGDLNPKWTEVWSHVNLGKIFDVTDQRDRAVNEYRQALRTKDDTQGALEEAQKYIAQKYQRPRNNN